jgi:hypothetical protein
MLQVWKLSYKWLGLYKVWKAIPNKGTYLLEEFDKTELSSTYSSNCLKKFVQRNRFYMLIATNTDQDDDSFTNKFTDSRDNELPVLNNLTIC